MIAIEVGDDVLAFVFIEVCCALVLRPPLIVFADLHQEGIAAPDHVFDNARGPDHALGIIGVENQLVVAGADIENSDCAAHGAGTLDTS